MITIEQYKNRLKLTHPNYEINWNDFKGSLIKMKIKCNLHGEFYMKPYNLYYGRYCRLCGNNHSREKQLTKKEDFLKIANLKHNNFYKYNIPDKLAFKDKIEIICPAHGTFYQTGANHAKIGTKCPYCARINKNGRSLLSWKNYCNFNNKKSYIYIIECFNNTERFLKIGITTKKLEERYTKKFPYKYNILLFKEDNAENVWNIEKRILIDNIKDLYFPNKTFDGEYECLNIKIKDKIIKL